MAREVRRPGGDRVPRSAAGDGPGAARIGRSDGSVDCAGTDRLPVVARARGATRSRDRRGRRGRGRARRHAGPRDGDVLSNAGRRPRARGRRAAALVGSADVLGRAQRETCAAGDVAARDVWRRGADRFCRPELRTGRRNADGDAAHRCGQQFPGHAGRHAALPLDDSERRRGYPERRGDDPAERVPHDRARDAERVTVRARSRGHHA